MFCQKCGKEQVEDAVFCSSCGTKLFSENVRQADTTKNEPVQKPMYEPIQDNINKGCLKIFLILFGILLVLFIVIIALFSIGDETTATEKSVTTESTQAEKEAKEQQEKAEKEANELQDLESFKNSCEFYSYEDISRNPDSYKGKNLTYTGQVIQVLEEGNDIHFRLNVTAMEYVYTDTVYVKYTKNDNESRILEGDMVTIWGTFDGIESFETVLGNKVTAPQISARDVEIQNNNTSNVTESSNTNTTVSQSTTDSTNQTNSETKYVDEEYNEIIPMEFVGYLGNDPIYMSLMLYADATIEGYYYYDVDGIEIQLEGYCDEDLNMVLTATDDDYYEKFNGKIDGGEYFGTWDDDEYSVSFNLTYQE